MPEAVICGAARTPIGRAGKGSLVSLRADDMAAQVVQALLDAAPQLPAATIDDLILGCGLPGGEQGANLARAVAVELGLDTVPGTTVNRYCSSSLQSTRMAFHAIKAQEGNAFLSVGVESVSRLGPFSPDGQPGTQNPMFDPAGERSTAAAVDGADTWVDPRQSGQLPDLYIPMGLTAENVSRAYDVSRQEMDEFAARSQQLAEAATDSGFWAAEITRVVLPDGAVVNADDGPRRGTTVDSLAALKPAFRPDGRVTAGNSCPLNDGAAALLIVSDDRARELELPPLARIISTGISGLSPEIMGMGPVEASKRALALAGMTIDDVDLVEINEAFAAQVIPSARELGVDVDKLNVSGGAIAIGHPFGMTGARMTTTLLHNLRERDGQIGLATLCVGGGQGMAVIYERLS